MKYNFWWLLVLGFVGSIMQANSNVLYIPEGVLAASGLDTVFVAKCALFLAFVLLWTILWGKILKTTVKMPVIAGQIIGGLLIGPSLIDIKKFSYFSAPVHVFDTVTGQMYEMVSSDLFIFFIVLLSSVFTVSYLLWIAGHETDVRDIMKVGLTASSAGVFGAVFPIIMTVGASALFLAHRINFLQSIALGLIFSATSVSIPVAMLFAYNKMHLKTSKATLGGAIIDDIVAVILLSLFFIFLQSGALGDVHDIIQPEHTSTIAEALVYMMFSFALLFFVGYYLIPPIIKWLKRNHKSHLIPSVANGSMLLYFAGAELIGGLAGITGAYFAGLFHRMGDNEHKAEKTISPFVNGVLLPLFLGSIGLQVDVSVLSASQWGVVALLFIVAIISKLLACGGAAWLSNVSGRRKAAKWTALESYIFGSSMVARGEVGLVVATILNGTHVITPDQYIIGVVVIVLTTIAAPIMLSIGFSRLEIIEREAGKGVEYTLNIGLFKIIGTTQMFNIIVQHLEKAQKYQTSIQISEGRKIVNIEGLDVRVILCPDDGVVFKGNRVHVHEIIQSVKGAVNKEVGRLSVF